MCDKTGIISINLYQMGLSGTIDVDALREIHSLRHLSLMNNSFSGKIPDFHLLGALKALYLSGNEFSGEIPSDYFSKMMSLKKVWLSQNKFTGKIPESLGKLNNLIELHLENNQFSGAIPDFEHNKLTNLDMSNNNLEGEVPASLSKFDAKTFAGNEGLCGKLLNKECKSTEAAAQTQEKKKDGGGGPNAVVITGVAVGAVVVLLILVLFIWNKRRTKQDFDMLGKEDIDEVVEVVTASSALPVATQRKTTAMESSRKVAPVESSRKVASSDSTKSSRKGPQNGGRSMIGDLEMVNEERGKFGLPDLMKASAEVLGNGGLGSAYKAVMANGVSVVVKRMREMNRLGRDGFDAEMRMLGKLRHPNILTPLAYHYRKEEKLVVSEYVPKGSLSYVLHGDRGVSHAELNWPTRLKIIQGVARGLGYLHSEFPSSELPHGNLKSCNVLLGTNYEPVLADYAFHPLINTTHAPQALFAYRSPEYALHQQISPKSDIFCLGIIILEIITGKFPSQYLTTGNGGIDVVQWVHSAINEKREEELMDPEIAKSTESLAQIQQLLHIGACCTETNAEQRQDLRELIRRIEEIQVI